MKTKAFKPKRRQKTSRYKKVGDYLIPERLAELERKDSLTVDEYREMLVDSQSRILDFSSTIDGWASGVYDLPFAELIPMKEIRKECRESSCRQASLSDVVWCYYTAMTMELPSWRVEQLLCCKGETLQPKEAMIVYETAQGLMEDCGIN